VTHDGRTRPMVTPGKACALCKNTDLPGLNVPVFTADKRAAYPLVCQYCLSTVLGTVFQMLGHQGDRLAELAVVIQAR